MLKNLSTFIFGEPLLTRLPDRVRENITAQQIEAEKLISWV
jgi:hypothetical protein